MWRIIPSLLTRGLLSMSSITTSSYHKSNKKRRFRRDPDIMENHEEHYSDAALPDLLQTSSVEASSIESLSSHPAVRKKKWAKHRNFRRPVKDPEPCHDQRAEHVRIGHSVEQPKISNSNSSVAEVPSYIKKLVLETQTQIVGITDTISSYLRVRGSCVTDLRTRFKQADLVSSCHVADSFRPQPSTHCPGTRSHSSTPRQFVADVSTSQLDLTTSSGSENSNCSSSSTLCEVDGDAHLATASSTPSEVSSRTLSLGNVGTFLEIDADIRIRILDFLLVRSERISPGYNSGSIEIEADWMNFENIDASIFLVNKGLSKDASQIFYGRNTFELDDPRIASWWLKRIGDNLQHLKLLALVFRRGSCAFDVPWERVWHNVLLWLCSRHRLDRLSLNFNDWGVRPSKTFGEQDIGKLQADTAIMERESIWYTLGRFRGIPYVKVYAEFFTSRSRQIALRKQMAESKQENSRHREPIFDNTRSLASLEAGEARNIPAAVRRLERR